MLHVVVLCDLVASAEMKRRQLLSATVDNFLIGA
jgi:hypothetical protein